MDDKSINLKQQVNNIAQVQDGENKSSKNTYETASTNVENKKTIVEKANQLFDESAKNKKQTPKVLEKNNSSSKSGLTNVKVPKKEAVVPFTKKVTKIDENKIKRKLEKQQRILEQKREKALHQQEKLELKNLRLEEREAKKIKKEKIALSKEESVKLKEQKRLETKALEEQKQKERIYKEKGEKDYGLNDLDTLEKRVLKRKDDEDERKKRILIIILIVLLVCMISFGSCTIVRIVDEQKPKPVLVDITVEADNLDPLIPVDPNNPDAGYLDRIVYPGDTINIKFYVVNNAVTESFPVFVRFRVYIIIDELTEHSVFTPTFVNPDLWFSWNNNVDDWYYYGDSLQVGEENKLEIINKLTLRTDLGNEYQGKKFTLVLRIESIEGTEESVQGFESWWLAPEEWFTFMGLNPNA